MRTLKRMGYEGPFVTELYDDDYLAFDPEFETAEYAVMVRSDAQGRGIGRRLAEEKRRS